MARKFYTIDDLYNFCKDNHFEAFSSTKHGAPLIIQSVGTFESADNITDGLMTVKLKSCHTGKNRNKSGISDDTMELYKDSFKGRPILGAIYKTDTGEYEFRAHDMEIVEDEDGIDVNYIEQPIGVISQTATPYLEYDKKEDKNYLMVEGTIFADYSKAAEILERRRTCKCSVEIAVEEMSYNCAEDYLSIDKFHFIGVTILGYQQDGVTEIQEGMKGSKITIDDFSEKHNSMFSNDCQDKLIEILDKLNTTLLGFNKLNLEEEGGDEEMDGVENIVVEEGLEVTTEEVVVEEEESTEETHSEEETTIEETSDSEDGEVVVETNSYRPSKLYVVEDDRVVSVSFEISHEDIRCALNHLIGIYEEEDNEWYWINKVYDDYFIFENWNGDKLYKQHYAMDGDNVSLSGDRQEVFKMILTESEKLAIEKIRENYADLEAKYNELVQFKADTEAAQLQAQKDAIFANEKYAKIVDTKLFKSLIANSKDYSVEECEQKANEILDDFSTYAANFAAVGDTSKPQVFGFGIDPSDTKKNKKKKAYGKLFD